MRWLLVSSSAVLLLACSESPDPGADARSDQRLADHGASDAVDAATDGPGGDAAACGDEHAPWAGGAAYYAQWQNGPPSDPSFFPIAVWLQSPSKAAEYQAIGVNLFIGLWQGPTEGQLSDLASAGMEVFCAQNAVGLDHLTDTTIRAWTQQDEPDNAQPDGQGGYLPCVEPSEIQSRYQAMVAADATRPVYLNFGQGVANTDWVGRGTCTGHTEHYPEYIKGADIVSFDIYPAVSKDANVAGKLWYVAKGVESLRQWADYMKPVWNWLETTHISNPEVKPTPHQVRAEVWMSLIHGSMGIGYFCHQFEPSFIEAGLLADAEIKAAVSALNQQITELAPVLNSPTITNAASVSSSNAEVPVATMVKRHGGALYIFAAAMRDAATTATFSGLTCVPADATVEVLGEERQLAAAGGAFSDDFAGYEVHLYKIAP